MARSRRSSSKRLTARASPLKAVTAAKKRVAVAVKKAAARPRAKKPSGARLFDPAAVRTVAREVERWTQADLERNKAKMPLRRERFVTDSGIPIPDVLTAADRQGERAEQLGLPGQFPFTRGVQTRMYRARLWTMRQFAGFGTPADTN